MPIPRPRPVRTDGSNAFARHSIEIRATGLIDEAAERNPDYPVAIKDGLHKLAHDIRTDSPLPHIDSSSPDAALWNQRFEGHEHESWLDTDWFFAEMLAYRLVTEITGFLETRRDVFSPFKMEEMSGDSIRELVGISQEGREGNEDRLLKHLQLCLWGNRIDLSIRASKDQGTDAEAHHLLTNHFQETIDHLLKKQLASVHIVADNAATELAMDMALIDFLLESHLARQVVLHVKPLPVLVSDALVKDVWELIWAMNGWGPVPQALSMRLEEAITSGRLVLQDHLFWDTDGGFFELPGDVHSQFSTADLVISKGDANYRRASNDAIWAPGTTLCDALPDFPAPLLLLRTLKSDTLLEVRPEVYRRLDHSEPDWKVTGKYGVAQFFEGA